MTAVTEVKVLEVAKGVVLVSVVLAPSSVAEWIVGLSCSMSWDLWLVSSPASSLSPRTVYVVLLSVVFPDFLPCQNKSCTSRLAFPVIIPAPCWMGACRHSYASCVVVR